MLPQISVILTYYDGQEWLFRAVRSVQEQQGVIWELIIIDDGSKQSPESILKAVNDERIHFRKKKHAGKGAALNDGVKDARAAIVCFLDQDDIMLPGRLKKQFEVFANNHRVDVVYSDYERRFDNGDMIDRFISYQASNQECLHKMAIGQGLISMQTIMLRKQTFFKVGGFSELDNLTGLDDLEFFARLLISGANLTYKPGIVQCWIQHDRNYSQSDQFQEARLNLLEHLSGMSLTNRHIESEMRHFRFHAYYMRGLYFMEDERPDKAAIEFWKAILSRPNYLNTYYLIFKCFLLKKFLKKKHEDTVHRIS